MADNHKTICDILYMIIDRSPSLIIALTAAAPGVVAWIKSAHNRRHVVEIASTTQELDNRVAHLENGEVDRKIRVSLLALGFDPEHIEAAALSMRVGGKWPLPGQETGINATPRKNEAIINHGNI